MTSTTAVSNGVVQSAGAGPLSLTISFDPSSNSYTLTAPSSSETFSPSDLSSSSTTGFAIYQKTNGDELELVTASPSTGKALNYVGLGIWQSGSSNGSTANDGYNIFDYGTPTPASAVPRTGEASYDVDLVGVLAVPGDTTKELTGPGSFEADFLSGLFKANIYPAEKDLSSGSSVSGGSIQLIAVGSLSSSDETFSGQAQFTDNAGSTYYTGPIAGHFYGPSAQEVGASFNGDNPNGGSIIGSFVGANSGSIPGENLTLTNLYVQQIFYAPTVEMQTNYNTTDGFFGVPLMGIADMTLSTTGSISYSGATSNTHGATLTSADVVASTLPNFTTYETTSGGLPIEFDVYNLGPGNTELALTYMDFGIWKQNATIPAQNGELTDYSVWGVTTPNGVLSRLTGTGQYTGVAYGTAINSSGQYDLTGTSSLTANFSSQSVTGSMTLAGPLEGSGTTNNFGTFTFSGAIQPPSGSPPISTIQVSQGGTGVGHLNLEFFGPSAQEAGGPFQLLLNNGQPNVANITGVVAAKQH